MKHLVLTAVLATALSATSHATPPKGAVPDPLNTKAVQRLIRALETMRSPNVYAAVYFPPRWIKPLDGLKSITVEAIAEEAAWQIQKKKIKLTVIDKPIAQGPVGVAVVRRSGGGLPEGLFMVFVYHHPRNSWGALGFPIPYKRGILLDADDRWMEDAVNDDRPFDGPLYEFDEATIKTFAALEKKADQLIKKIQDAKKE